MILDERQAALHFLPTLVERTGLREGVLLRVGGRFQLSDQKNANNRVYSTSLWETVLPKIQEKIRNRSMIGELDHPEGRRQSSLKEGALVVTHAELKPSGEVYGEYEVIDNPNGAILESYHRAGCMIGLSSRGDGTVTPKDGLNYVDEDNYHLEAWDAVTNPSTPGAYPGVLAESAQDHHEHLIHGALVSLVESVQINSAEGLRTLTKIHEAADELSDPRLRENCHKIVNEKLQPVGAKEQPMPEKKTPVGPQGSVDHALINEMVTARTAEKTTELDRLMTESKDRLLRVNERNDVLQVKLDAAEKIINEQNALMKTLKEELTAAPGAADAVLREKHEAAEKIINELLAYKDAAERLVEAAVEMKNEEKTRADAATSLAASMLEKSHKTTKQKAIKDCLEQVTETMQESVRTILATAPDAATVITQFQGLTGLMQEGTITPREPLPPQGAEHLDESTAGLPAPSAQLPGSENDLLMEGIVDNMPGGI